MRTAPPLGLPAIAAGLLLLTACNSTRPAQRATSVATALPAQTAVIAPATPPPRAILAPPPAPAEVTRAVDQMRLKITELPREFGYGPFQAYQPNEAAVVGFDDPVAVLKRMNETGRIGGYVQQLTTRDGPTAAYTIEVWKDAAGAAQYFDQFPRPDKSLQFHEITLPQPPGEQSFAYQYETEGKIGYSIAWRRGRVILGAGDWFPPGKESLDRIMVIVNLLDEKARSAQP